VILSIAGEIFNDIAPLVSALRTRREREAPHPNDHARREIEQRRIGKRTRSANKYAAPISAGPWTRTIDLRGAFLAAHADELR
jgi:hypothetical protein